ncbi:caspase family protein [Streptomyces sp. NPDC093089]|uniref:HD domain-containing protein n=1 Tax=Streptomyces sp. NPDC093089 TaxID=3366024 RepID=UPI003822325C
MDVQRGRAGELGARVGTATDAAEEQATGRRRALLIGVGRTEFLERDEDLARRYPPLGFVDRDVELVGTALAASGYTVEALHPGHPSPERRNTGVGSIVSAVEEFLLSCAAGDTAFLYVSAHGVTVGEREYLLTSDARPRADGSLIAQTVLETAPDVLLGTVPEGVTVVVALDTCRTDQPPTAAPPRLTRLVDSSYENVAWLRGCGPGQAAYADPEKGSHFGIALSEALSPHSPSRTFEEVHVFVRARIDRLASLLTEPPPAVEFQCAEELAARLVLCDGSEETELWTEAVDASALWKHTSQTAVHERVKERLGDLAREVAKSRLGTDSALATPWSDPAYPIRVMERLGHLVDAAGLADHELLSPAETAALLAAPLLHEGVVAVALSELAALRPDRIDRSEDGRGRTVTTSHDRLVCDAARDVSRAHSQVAQTAETLRRRHLPAPATAADHWLRHRFIADWDLLWDGTGDYASIDHLIDRVVTAVAAAGPGEPSPQNRVLMDHQIRQVLAHVTVAPGSSPRIDRTGELRWSEHPAVTGNAWRARDLAYLVWLASLLAADPRRMSSALVDHLGSAHRRLVPSEVVAALPEYRLHAPNNAEGARDLAVNFRCPHPALHAALEELAATADASVRARHKGWKEARTTAPDLLRGIPRKVTTEFLEPLAQQYTKPLERFRLAEDEIRPLLMGTQLYGDKMLAVRELYQNALDACRHRQLRTAYGRKIGKYGATDAGREPDITFVQGYDDGRPYIECRDTGTGMSRKKLTSMFARAGKRYEQDPDFVQERRNWRRAGIEPVPFNSRFGIGVFSYFMLAEEVVVTTAPVDPHGNPSRTEAPLQATIQSGSGLLEIVPTSQAPERGGTTIRLYLNADGEPTPSLVKTLRGLLWVSDHRVTAVELDRDGGTIRSEEWQPGRLQASEHWPAAPARAGDDAWIVQGPGQLLLDGVVVKNAPEVKGYVFNLRERDQPVPTVDRNELLRYDREGVTRRVLAGVPEAVASFEEVSLRWLWELALKEPKLAVRVFDALVGESVGFLHPTHEERSLASSTFRLRDVGCLPSDRTAIHQHQLMRPFGSDPTYESTLFNRWRNSLLGILDGTREPFAPHGYPKPVGLDALLFERGAPDGSWAGAMRVAARSGESLAVAVRAQRRFAIAGVEVPEISGIGALKDMFPTEVMADLCGAYRPAAPSPRVGQRIPPRYASLLSVATAHRIPLSEALASVRDLARRVPLPGLEDIPLLAEDTPSDTDVMAALFMKGEAVHWQEGVAHPVDLLVGATSVERRRQVVEQIDALKQLGFSLGSRCSGATLTHRALTGDERRLLSFNVDGEAPWLKDDLTVFDVLERSAIMRIPMGRVVEQINSLTTATGISAPQVPDTVTGWTAPSWVSGLLPWPDEEPGPFGPWRVTAAGRHSFSREDSAAAHQDLRHLDACGVLAPGCLELVAAHMEEIAKNSFINHVLDVAHPYSKYGTGRWNLDARGLGVEPLAHLASVLKGTLAAQAEHAAALDPPFPLAVADVPDSLRALGPDVGTRFLFEQGYGHGHSMAFRSHLTCGQLLANAAYKPDGLGETVRIAQAFLPAGGPALPGPFTGPGSEVLEHFVPDDFDLAAFDPGLLGPGTLGPLELVLVAGRFGWTLGKAYERYAPFRCLGLDVTVEAPIGEEREIVPDWRDVIVLTARLTGRAPAVEGLVDPDHVLLCSEETDLSEEEVLERLCRYRRLFELLVPTTTGGPRP